MFSFYNVVKNIFCIILGSKTTKGSQKHLKMFMRPDRADNHSCDVASMVFNHHNISFTKKYLSFCICQF